MAKIWKMPVQKVYDSLEELKAYDELYQIASKCGYSDCKSLWRDNPTIGGSVDPVDFGIVLYNFRLEGTYRKSESIGKMESFSLKIKSSSPRKAMDDLRANAYECGYSHVLFTKIKKNNREIPMMQALELE